MTSEARDMLNKVYALFKAEFQDPVQAWDHMLRFIAADSSGRLLVQTGFDLKWLSDRPNLANSLAETYSQQILRTDYHDHMGDLFTEDVVPHLKDIASLKLIPMKTAHEFTNTALGSKNPETAILDPCVGTGRFLMALHKKAPKAKLMGAEQDLRLMRIALTNMAIHNIPAVLLHADHLSHELDISKPEGRANWEHANRWEPCIQKMTQFNRRKDNQEKQTE